MKITHAPARSIVPVAISLAGAFRLALALSLLPLGLPAQTRPSPGEGGGPGGGIGGGGGISILPIFPGGGGGGVIIGGGNTTTSQPTINVVSGAAAGSTVTASVNLGEVSSVSSSSITYQWSVTGARLTSDARSASITFVADNAGTVSLSVAISAAGTSYTPSATVGIISTETAGTITAPVTVAANVNTVTASVPAAQNNDRTFRWTVSGGATIAGSQTNRNVTIRPGSPGLKQIVCNVNLKNLVTVPLRSHLLVLGTGEPVAVTVQRGCGGGTFPAGSHIDIFANPPGPGEVFAGWVGATSLLGSDPLALALPRATITVPTAPVELTATYRAAPIWTATTVANFNPQVQTSASNISTTVITTLRHFIPTDPLGLVFLLHATGGDSADWFERPQQILLVRELVAAGYGVAFLDSINRTAGTWASPSVLANNLDALNHAAALDRFIAEGRISSATPVFFLGHAAGANAALRYADLLATATPARPIKGAVLFLSAGLETLAATSGVPQFFAVAANDSTLGTAGLEDATNAYQTLLGRGIAAGMVTNEVAPLFPGCLLSLRTIAETFGASDAEAIWTALKTAGVLDSNSYVKTIPSTTALTAALPAAYRDLAAAILAEINVAAAEREFFSDETARIVRFLHDRVAGVAAPSPGRLINLSLRGDVAYLGDSLSLGFSLVGTQKANVLIRAVGPGLSRFRVSDPLVATRLEVYRGTTVLAANEGWDSGTGAAAKRTQFNAAATAAGAFALANNSLDSAVLLELDPGTYTIKIAGVGGAVGEVLAEVYDVSRNPTRLGNFSTLTRIQNEGDLVTPGFVIAGTSPRTLIVRAVSQGLTAFGLASDLVLGDPRITVMSGNQVIASNNSWGQANSETLTAAFPVVGAFALSSASDAALLSPLSPGSYTVQAGAAPTSTNVNQTGAILVEVYEVP